MKTVGNEISEIAQVANRLTARIMREEGLGSAEAELIQLVREQPGISQKEICGRLNMDKGAVARRAVNLEQKGYLTRKGNPSDGRSQLLYPSEKTDSLKNSGTLAETAFYDWLLEALSERERETFCEILNRLGDRAAQEGSDGYPNVCGRLQRPVFGADVVKRSRKRELSDTAAAKQAEDISGASAVKPIDENSDTTSAKPVGDIAAAPASKRKKSEPDVWLL